MFAQNWTLVRRVAHHLIVQRDRVWSPNVNRFSVHQGHEGARFREHISSTELRSHRSQVTLNRTPLL